MECQKFDLPAHPTPKIIVNSDGTTTWEEIDEMDIYVWKKDYELIHSQKADFTEKEKQVFPIILDQCSPSLKLQLEGAKHFQETCEKNNIMELRKLVRGFCCKHNQNNDNFYAVFSKKWPDQWWLPKRISSMNGYS